MLEISLDSKNRIEDIKDYWGEQSERYTNLNLSEMQGDRAEIWQELILSNAPKKDKLKILDIGCGPGFFSIILAQKGHEVTGIDITDEMITNAKNNSSKYNLDIDFQLVNGDKLPFNEEEFDLVVCRDVVWNLVNPNSYFKDWSRVLKNKGRIVYFDATWYLYLFDEKNREKFDLARETLKKLGCDDFYGSEKSRAMEKIAYDLPLSREKRPQWDKENLPMCGFNVVKVDENIGHLIWDEKQIIRYSSAPEFMVVAEKI